VLSEQDQDLAFEKALLRGRIVQFERGPEERGTLVKVWAILVERACCWVRSLALVLEVGSVDPQTPPLFECGQDHYQFPFHPPRLQLLMKEGMKKLKLRYDRFDYGGT
jgi:hypothetical protein